MKRLFNLKVLAALALWLPAWAAAEAVVAETAIEVGTPDHVSVGQSLVAVEIETVENSLDSCMDCGCRIKGELEPRTDGRWWVTFGLVRPDEQEGWAAAASLSHCAAGSFERIAVEFGKTVGAPYVILDLGLNATVAPDGEVVLEVMVSSRKLSGFDKRGRPAYEGGERKRTLGLAEERSITFPLLIPDEREKESFGVHEVLVRLQGTVLGQKPPASYGVISVSADVPGAEVLLDGGFVGRIMEGRSLSVQNVRAGKREVRVRDFSGREANRQVVVKKDQTAKVALKLLNFSAEVGADLVPLGRNPQGYDEYWRARDGAVLVRIPDGEFLRGSKQDAGEPHERPQRRIRISEFLIDKTEVTWRQFRKYVEATGASLPSPPLWGTPDDYPASRIVWEEARQYCEWVGGRLPTEAEWEKASRGTDGRKYPWGEKWIHDRCNSRDGGPHRPLSVGSYRDCLSPYGVLDMAGNVWEWCSDWYEESYYAESPAQDPQGPLRGRLRLLRGGAWISPGLWLRSAFRYKVSPTFRNVHYGLRCVQDAPEP